MTTIGVLDLQGATAEHKKQLESLGVEAVFIKKPEQLKEIDGLNHSWWRKYSDWKAYETLWFY